MTPLVWTAFLLAGAAPAEPAAAFVSRFHDALKGDRREAVLELMAADAVVFESGGAESSRDEYAAQHLEPDMAFACSTVTTIEDQRVVEMGEAALVLSRTATSGTFEGKPVSSKGVETMVVRRVDGGWRIAHIHWSSRRVPPRGSSAPAAEHLSAAGLASALGAAGLKVEGKGTIRQPFFAVGAQVLAIGADEIEVFEFATAADAEKGAATVSADGGTVGTSAMHWMAPPHFHRRGRTILIHLGNGAEVRTALERLAGAPFAGRP